MKNKLKKIKKQITCVILREPVTFENGVMVVSGLEGKESVYFVSQYESLGRSAECPITRVNKVKFFRLNELSEQEKNQLLLIDPNDDQGTMRLRQFTDSLAIQPKFYLFGFGEVTQGRLTDVQVKDAYGRGQRDFSGCEFLESCYGLQLPAVKLPGVVLNETQLLNLYCGGLRSFQSVVFTCNSKHRLRKRSSLSDADFSQIKIQGFDEFMWLYERDVKDFSDIEVMGKVDVRSVDLSGCILISSDLEKDYTETTDLSRFVLDREGIEQLYKAGEMNFQGAIFDGVDCDGLDLSEANIDDVKVSLGQLKQLLGAAEHLDVSHVVLNPGCDLSDIECQWLSDVIELSSEIERKFKEDLEDFNFDGLIVESGMALAIQKVLIEVLMSKNPNSHVALANEILGRYPDIYSSPNNLKQVLASVTFDEETRSFALSSNQSSVVASGFFESPSLDSGYSSGHSELSYRSSP